MITFLLMMLAATFGYSIGLLLAFGKKRRAKLWVVINNIEAINNDIDDAIDIASFNGGMVTWTFTPPPLEVFDGKAKVVVRVIET